MTEHHQLQDQFRQAQKMEAIGRLAGGIAHDFNNLLTAIIGYSDLLLRDVGADKKLRPQIEEIGAAGRRAALLTGQLLAFSGKQVLQPMVLDLNGKGSICFGLHRGSDYPSRRYREGGGFSSETVHSGHPLA